MIVEIKEIEMDMASQYTYSNYPTEGFYINTDEHGVKAFMLMKNKNVIFLANGEDVLNLKEYVPPVLEKEVEEDPTGVVSEEFVLNLLSVALHKKKV